MGGKYRHWTSCAPRAAERSHGGTVVARAQTLARATYQRLPFTAKDGEPFVQALPDIGQRMLHQIDRDASGSIKATQQVTSPQTRDTYLMSSLVEEAITSSQLEGASTTRDAREGDDQAGRAPRDRSERMILNNYRALQFIRQIRDEPLTPGIVFELQRILTEGTLDEPDAADDFAVPTNTSSSRTRWTARCSTTRRARQSCRRAWRRCARSPTPRTRMSRSSIRSCDRSCCISARVRSSIRGWEWTNGTCALLLVDGAARLLVGGIPFDLPHPQACAWPVQPRLPLYGDGR